MKFIEIEVVCVKENSNRHQLSDEDVYLEKHFVAQHCIIAIVPVYESQKIPMARSIIVTTGATLQTTHDVKELVQMVENAELNQ